MADSSDAETAIELAIGAVLYPAGASVAVASPVVGAPCRVSRGWPEGEILDADLRAGIVNVTVFPMRGGFRNISPPQLQWQETASPAPTCTVTQSANALTFGGTCDETQVAAVLIGSAGKQAAFAYRMTNTDTPSSVAAALAAAIPSATAKGAVLTVPPWNGTISAAIVADGVASMAVQYQERPIVVTVWAPTPPLRDVVCSKIGAALAYSYRLTLPDGSQGLLRQTMDSTDDVPGRADVWRRDLTYTMRYTTVITETQPRVTAIVGAVAVGQAALIQIGAATLPGQVYVDASGAALVDALSNAIGVEVLT